MKYNEVCEDKVFSEKKNFYTVAVCGSCCCGSYLTVCLSVCAKQQKQQDH